MTCRALLKAIGADDFDPKIFVPEDSRCFAVTLRLDIGLQGSSGSDNFEILVCTPAWLAENVHAPRWGRFHLIVPEYDYSAIAEVVGGFVQGCDGENWDAVAAKLSRSFAWEFEDYVE